MPHESFARHADRYDDWFRRFPGNKIFPLEVACLKKASASLARPWLEVGVGTGRFAELLGIDEGIDPAPAALQIAKARGINIRQGIAEALPYKDKSFGGIFMIITLCFLDDPLAGILECRRVLSENGSLILGMIPADSPWGRFYGKKKQEGHLFYKEAKLFKLSEVESLMEKASLRIESIWSTLLAPPDQDDYQFAHPLEGLQPEAGFVVLRASRA
jgi:SAM-dependent methyltransferase